MKSVIERMIPEEEQLAEEAAALPAYGQLLCDKIRAKTTNFEKLPDFEKFVLDRGFYYDTEEKLKAAYDRAWKSRHGILITEDEFVTEAGKGDGNKLSQWGEGATREAYVKLAEFAAAGKISNSEVYSYAVHCWCIRKPEAIVAYQEGRDKWIVNNCAEEITEEAARFSVIRLTDARSENGLKRHIMRQLKGDILLYCSSQRGQIQAISTITYAEKRKSVSFGAGFGSRMMTATPPIPRPFLLCW